APRYRGHGLARQGRPDLCQGRDRLWRAPARPLYRGPSRGLRRAGRSMARVDFYRLTRDPAERVLPAIAGRILGGGERLLVVAGPAMQRQAIDEALWT